MKTARIDGMVEPEIKTMLEEMAKADGRSNIGMLSKLIKEAYEEMKKNEN